MKRFLASLFMMANLATAAAQEEPRLLTMEEAVLGSGLMVENLPVTWRADGAIYTTVE